MSCLSALCVDSKVNETNHVHVNFLLALLFVGSTTRGTLLALDWIGLDWIGKSRVSAFAAAAAADFTIPSIQTPPSCSF